MAEAAQTLTIEQFARCTGAPLVKASTRLPDFVTAMGLYGVNQSPERVVMFLANVGHESGGLRFQTELWGATPTPAQRRYERNFDAAWPPVARDMTNSLAWSLGNSERGDGYKYRGHGDIQVTGRAGHVEVRDSLRARFGAVVPDFEIYPEQLAQPKWSALSAADFVVRRGCLPLMDAGNFDGVCDTINMGRLTSRFGDSNGFADRLELFNAGRAALGIN